MVHMNDCPTIRSDCVSSNRVVVNWNPYHHQPQDISYQNLKRPRQKSLPISSLDDHQQKFIQKSEKKKKQHKSMNDKFCIIYIKK